MSSLEALRPLMGCGAKPPESEAMPKIQNLKSRVPVLGARLPKQRVSSDALYQSPDWRSFARRMVQKLGGVCSVCGSTSRVTADHIREIKDGGSRFDEQNIQLLCARCHNKKTAAARRTRVGGH